MLLHMANHSCLWLSSILLYIYIYHIFFSHSSVDGHWGCLHTLAIVNNVSTNIREHVSFQISNFVPFGYIPRSGIAGSYDSLIVLSLVFWETSILFSTIAATIYIPTNSVRGLPFLYILVNMLFLFFLMTAILTDMRWYLTVSLICISLMTSDVENLFMCLLAICLCSLVKCLFKSFACF